MFSLVSYTMFESTKGSSIQIQKIGQKDRRRIKFSRYWVPYFATKYYRKIEEHNSINVNVFGYEEKQFLPIYVSKQHNKDVLNLLLITEQEEKHYVLGF